MKPVNLLPEQHRPRRAKGSKSGSAYILVGALSMMLLFALAYVVTANRATDRADQVAVAKREASEAESKLASLSRYGDFAAIAATRKASVSQLSQARFDWERFLRELAHVLPAGVWLSGVDASTTGDDYGSAGENGGKPDPEAKPGATLEGCAKRQPAVATLMVRLRKLHAVEEVDLGESVASDDGGDSAGEGVCGRFYKFSVKAVFTPAESATPDAAKRPRGVPASLGGGS